MSARKPHAAQRGSPTRLLPESATRLGATGVFAGSFPLLNGLVIALCQTIRLLKHEVGTELGSLRETGSSRSRVTLAELSCGPR